MGMRGDMKASEIISDSLAARSMKRSVNSDSTRKPKLPKVWVEFWASGNPRTVYGFNPGWVNSDHTVHQYAPVQKPRRCVWRKWADGLWEGCARHIVAVPPSDYCQFCGGKIKVKS